MNSRNQKIKLHKREKKLSQEIVLCTYFFYYIIRTRLSSIVSSTFCFRQFLLYTNNDKHIYLHTFLQNDGNTATHRTVLHDDSLVVNQ